MSETPLLEVQNLKKHFSQETSLLSSLLGEQSGKIQAVDGVSFTLERNGSRGVIGESGCGKTTLLRTVMGLYEPTDGEILFEGQPVSGFSESEWQKYRQNVSIIFQDPFNSLDPKFTVQEAIREPLEIHNIGDQDTRVREILEKVSLTPAETYLNRRPSNLSGGEKQRVSIARALVTEPDLVLADEPVSMLDVSTQASILNLLSDLIEESGIAMLYISHDLSTVSYTCEHLDVMYLGRVVESGKTKKIIDDPKHPYTQALLQAIPIPDPNSTRERTRMDGAPRDPVDIGEGCRFRDRCPERMEICEVTPRDYPVNDDQSVACHLYYDHRGMGVADSELPDRPVINSDGGEKE